METATERSAHHVSYFRNFIFGVEDSLVSTVGLLSGVAIAGVSKEMILLTGVVLIFVEAFSMAAGSYLSESSGETFASGEESARKEHVISALIMFVSYFAAGFIPLFPYLIWLGTTALWTSIAVSVGALFVLGALGAHLSRTNIIKSGVRMMGIGGIAIAIGFGAAMLVAQFS